MESLGYVMIYFLRGSLPWQGLRAASKKEKRELVLDKKERISATDLCHDLPHEFVAYFDHVRSLRFEDKPKYSYMRKVFRHLFVREGFEYDYVFDWTILKYLMSTR